MLLECAFAIALMTIGLLLGLGLVRIAALAAFALIVVAAVAFVIFSVLAGDWSGWFGIGWRALATGLGAAVVSIPLLPYTPFFNKRK
ncbi:MAG: hypothetical protein WC789_12475 [Lentisphaeria bacterium]|jgi:hypothetical protein